MPVVSACPDITQLHQLLVGKLPVAEMEMLLQHLETCGDCANKISTMPNDSLADLVRQSKSMGESPFKVRVQQLVDNLKQANDLASERTIPPGAARAADQTHEGSPRSGDTHPPEGNVADPEFFGILSPPQAPDELGRLGNYRILKVLGAGGMGVVYQAEDVMLNRLVALKAILPALGASANVKKRFLREAKAAAAIKHDHIVSIYQVGEERGVPFLAMEFLQGESLDDRLKREGKLPTAEVLRVGREMAEGLEAAHDGGLVHRDIKPANVWLETRGTAKPKGEAPRTLAAGRPVPARVKILDFGLARSTDEEQHLTQSGAIVGTPAYMAPEQAQSKPVDFRCDLFSLGVVLYRLCTGEMPFKGQDTISTLMAVATVDPPPPSTVNREVPQTLSDLVMQMLAKDPAERPVSARAVVDRLQALEQQPPVGRDAPAERGRARLWPRRLLPFAAAFLLILLPLGWFFGGAIVRIATNKGELIIDNSDPNIEVTVKAGSAIIHDKVKERRFVLTAGDYNVEVREEGEGGLRFTTKRVTITRNGKVTFDAHLTLAQAKLPDVVKGPVRLPDGKKDDVKKDPIKPPDIKKEDIKKDPVKPPDVKKVDIKKDPVKPPDTNELMAKMSGIEQLQIAEAVVALGGRVRLECFLWDPKLRYKLVESQFTARAEFSAKDLPPREWVRSWIETKMIGKVLATMQEHNVTAHVEMNQISFGNQPNTDGVLARLDLERIKVDVLDLDFSTVGDPGLEHLKRMSKPPLRFLSLNHTLVKDAGMTSLANLAKLEELHLAFTAVTDAGLAPIATLNLKGLNLRGTKVSDAGLKQVKKLPLVRLDLSDTSISDDGLAQLKFLKDLAYVNLRGTKVTAAGIDALRQARPKWFIDADFGTGGSAEDWVAVLGGSNVVRGNERYADLNGNKWVTDSGLENLKRRMKIPLGHLNLAHTLVTEAGLVHLKTLTELRGLDLKDTKVTAAGLKELAPLKNLVSLRLEGASLTDDVLRVLRETKMVPKWLNGSGNAILLAGSQVTDVGLMDLIELNSLKDVNRLDLCGTKVTDDGLAPVKALTKLQRLELNGTSIGDAGLARLKTLTNLSELRLRGTKVSDVGLAHLKTLTNLRELRLDGTNVTGSGIANFEPLVGLQRLDLSNTAVTDAGLKHFQSLAFLPILRLDGTEVSDAGLVHLGELENLRELSLTNTHVTAAGLADLRKALPKCKIDGPLAK